MLDGGGAWLYTREKPETKPEMETDGLALYEPVLEEVIRAFGDGYDFDQEYRYRVFVRD